MCRDRWVGEDLEDPVREVGRKEIDPRRTTKVDRLARKPRADFPARRVERFVFRFFSLPISTLLELTMPFSVLSSSSRLINRLPLSSPNLLESPLFGHSALPLPLRSSSRRLQSLLPPHLLHPRRLQPPPTTNPRRRPAPRLLPRMDDSQRLSLVERRGLGCI